MQYSGDLKTTLSSISLMKVRNLGKISQEEVIEKLRTLDLHLKPVQEN